MAQAQSFLLGETFDPGYGLGDCVVADDYVTDQPADISDLDGSLDLVLVDLADIVQQGSGYQ